MMNTATLVLLFCGFVGVFANDEIWMKLISAHIENAVSHHESDDKNIPELASELGLDTLLKYVESAGLAPQLAGRGPFTLFGPQDAAFARLPIALLNVLVDNRTLLNEILKFHVAIDSVVLSADIERCNDMKLSTLLGKDMRINVYKNKKVVTAAGSPIIMFDKNASNGVIHKVERVLLFPPGDIFFIVAKCPVLSILLSAVNVVPSVKETLSDDGPYTLFAPSDGAFDGLPKGCLDRLKDDKNTLKMLLEYHIVPLTGYSAGLSSGDKLKTVGGEDVTITINGEQVQINDSDVFYPDCTATNGVIHVISKVLFPEELKDYCGKGSIQADDGNKIYGIRAWRNLLN